MWLITVVVHQHTRRHHHRQLHARPFTGSTRAHDAPTDTQRHSRKADRRQEAVTPLRTTAAVASAMATPVTATTSGFCSSDDSLVLVLLLVLGKYKISAANANVTAPAHGQVHPLPLVTRAAALSRGPLAFMRAAKIKRQGKGGRLSD